MMEAELDALVAVARSGLTMPIETPARAWWVYPPAGGEAAYALVELGANDRVEGVAAVDRRTGSLLSSARLPGRVGHVTVDADRALALSGYPHGRARLVWAPSRQSGSPLYPLWEVRPAATTREAVYVDLAGRTWQRLEPAGPGGGGPPPDVPPSA